MRVPHGSFGLIYADPAWQYEMFSDKGYGKSPDAHYDCMTIDQLKAMRDEVLFSAGPNCVLFMWAVWPMIRQAMDVMSAWGFEYKTGGSWAKVTNTGKQCMGTGYVLRSASEPYIIGTLGKPKIKNHGTRNQLFTGDVPADLRDLGISITSERREHSRKPDEMAVLLQDLFEGPYLEMFARQQREGWVSWGNEITKFGDAA